jgi:hypothetical protein
MSVWEPILKLTLCSFSRKRGVSSGQFLNVSTAENLSSFSSPKNLCSSSTSAIPRMLSVYLCHQCSLCVPLHCTARRGTAWVHLACFPDNLFKLKIVIHPMTPASFPYLTTVCAQFIHLWRLGSLSPAAASLKVAEALKLRLMLAPGCSTERVAKFTNA